MLEKTDPRANQTQVASGDLNMSLLSDSYGQYCKPKLRRVLELLRLDKVFHRAEGETLFYFEDGKEKQITDFLGGYGSTIFGHNPEFAIASLKSALEKKTPTHAQASIRTQSTFLSQKLNEMIREEWKNETNFLLTLANSGTEAVEAAIKHALMEWSFRRQEFLVQIERKRHLFESKENWDQVKRIDDLIEKVEAARPVILAMDGSFHGKTAAALFATSNSDYRSMYFQSPVQVEFLNRLNSVELIQSRIQKHDVGDLGSLAFSSIAGMIFEPIQCEGGIFSLEKKFIGTVAEELRKRNVPLIADEIQTGVYRTGTFLASTTLEINPDYIILGKSLGAGMVKISGVLFKQERYQENFGLLHTSTFAEDEISSVVALEGLNFASQNKEDLSKKAESFEVEVKGRLSAISLKYPNVISDVRGRGFLIGVQFNFSDTSSFPMFLKWLYESGYVSYLFSSYLLHRHGLRVGVTLSQPDTLRLEPNYEITSDAVENLLKGLEDLIRVIYENKILRLTQHLWKNLPPDFDGETPSLPHKKRNLIVKQNVKKVGFITHLISTNTLKDIDVLFSSLPYSERQRFHKKFGPFDDGYQYHDQVIRGANGEEIHLHIYGLLSGSEYFAQSLQDRKLDAFFRVENLVKKMKSDGMEFVGLGQYTSIVTENATLLRRAPLTLTTGNSLTAGFAYEGLLKICRDRKLDLADLHVGVVGATGNICNVLTQLIADQSGELTLFSREKLSESLKLQGALSDVLNNSSISRDRVKTSIDLEDLIQCDVILAGTNSSEAILMPQHLKANAIILDVSVPSNIHPSVRTDRKDVQAFQGGFANLPFEQKISSHIVPCVAGQSFACMAETICIGLHNYREPLSYGALSKIKVETALRLAREAGFTLGSLKQEASF